MLRRKSLLLSVVICSIMLSYTVLVLAQDETMLADVIARKSVVKVTDLGWILTKLEIINNGSVPVFTLEIYEYYNPGFTLGDNLTIKYVNTVTTKEISGNYAGQIIIPIIHPVQLKAGESLEVMYWCRSHASGDFQIPASLVWYSFNYGENLIRTNILTGGLIVHVKSGLEQALDQALPYLISSVVFIITLIVLDYMRRNLRKAVSKVNEQKLFR